MKTYVLYEPNGRVHGVVTAPAQFAEEILGGTIADRDLNALDVTDGLLDPLQSYVDLETGRLIPLRPAPTSLLDLPVPATVTVRSVALGTSETYTVEDGSFDYSDAPGRYAITVQAWPHLDATFEVEL